MDKGSKWITIDLLTNHSHLSAVSTGSYLSNLSKICLQTHKI